MRSAWDALGKQARWAAAVCDDLDNGPSDSWIDRKLAYACLLYTAHTAILLREATFAVMGNGGLSERGRREAASLSLESAQGLVWATGRALGLGLSAEIVGIDFAAVPTYQFDGQQSYFEQLAAARLTRPV